MDNTNKRFEYVLSGCAHTRITLLDACEEDIAPVIRDVISKIEGKLQTHNVTGLYNAFAEPSNGRNMYKGNFFRAPLHADSGGLQMITRGMGVTEELKDKVYRSQAKYSGVAMCFDEIPATQERNASLRLFREDLVEEKAKETALNVVEQAKLFEELNTEAKIFLIVQGNCLDTYHKWADVCVKNIPQSLHHRIGGISVAGTTSGSGDKEDVERIYAFTSLPAPAEWKQRLHLLGIGSASRMLSVTGFMHSGGISENCLVSYDSTSHSSYMTFRKYLNTDSKIFDFGWDRTQTMKLYNFTNEYFQIKSEFDEYFDIVNETREFFIEKYGKDALIRYHEAMIATCMVSVYHCASVVEKTFFNIKEYKKMCKGKLRPLQYLPTIKSPEDYSHYMNQVGNYLSSKKVKKVGGFTSLDQFF